MHRRAHNQVFVLNVGGRRGKRSLNTGCKHRRNADIFSLNNSWQPLLGERLKTPEMTALYGFLKAERALGKTLYPAEDAYFRALSLTPPGAVKLVILGQDPYHGDDQAHGLAFSVQPGVRVPPSLKNIYKEQQSDLGITQPGQGCLEAWAKEGVLLLNTALSVEAGKAGSHQNMGWEAFTDAVIEAAAARVKPTVFMLWGSHAQKKGAKIDRNRHLVLEAPHPSPLSAYRGFFGCQHFSKANAFLEANGQGAINWKLNPIGEFAF
jgi:uracil-DNA glycosylase